MSDHIEHTCGYCNSLLHPEYKCPKRFSEEEVEEAMYVAAKQMATEGSYRPRHILEKIVASRRSG